MAAVNELESGIESLSDDELKAKTPELKGRIAQGETLEDLKVEAFAVAREAACSTFASSVLMVPLVARCEPIG